MDVRDFHRLFGPPMMKTKLAWDLLLADDSPVVTFAGPSLDLANRLYAPWYVGAVGQVPREDDRGQPLRFDQVGERWDELAPEHRAEIDEHAANLRDAVPALLVLPLYDLRDGTFLVLDGNHRLAASIRHEIVTRALAIALRGPLDRSVLRDLGRFVS